MFNEPASTLHDYRPHPAIDESVPVKPQDERLERLRAIVGSILAIQDERDPSQLSAEDIQGGAIILMHANARLLIRFDGRLIIDSEAAYDYLERECISMNLTPMLREHEGVQSVYIVEGRVAPSKTGWVWNLVLLIATILSVMYVGAALSINQLVVTPGELSPFEYGLLQGRVQNGTWPLHYWYLGIPYTLSLLGILGAHELGHYFAARRRKHAASLPFFIPFPLSIFGTFGAFIRLREPMRNRKILLEIGAAGPLAGFILAVPILLYGLATSPVLVMQPGGMSEGNSLIYALAKLLTFGQFLPNGTQDVMVNTIAWAGWTGLFVTGLNLLPLGQLDGGHVVYSLLGERAKQLYYPTLGVVGALALLSNGDLLFIFVMLLFFGRIHAVPLDNITPLTPRYRWLAIGTLAVFALTFVPLPLTQNGVAAATGDGLGMGAWVMLSGLVIVLAQRLRR